MKWAQQDSHLWTLRGFSSSSESAFTFVLSWINSLFKWCTSRLRMSALATVLQNCCSSRFILFTCTMQLKLSGSRFHFTQWEPQKIHLLNQNEFTRLDLQKSYLIHSVPVLILALFKSAMLYLNFLIQQPNFFIALSHLCAEQVAFTNHYIIFFLKLQSGLQTGFYLINITLVWKACKQWWVPTLQSCTSAYKNKTNV